MSRRLLMIGSLLMVATVVLWVADAASWIASSLDDRWSHLTLLAGLTAIAGAIGVRVFSPVATLMAKGRCAVCGRLTERGHTYCLDHLQETVNSMREKSRDRALPRRKSRV